MELISVIVPVYNVEKYLDRCVQSIVDQTYRNLEIILVDDGSPDNCGAMCDAWAAKDSRIKVIHKENGGLSDARNAGMAAATGTLMGFVDSDDWVDADYIAGMYHALCETGSDIAACDVCTIPEGDESFPDGGSGECTVCTPEQAIGSILQGKQFRAVAWNKLYKRELLRQERFPIGKYHEDEFFTYRILAKAKKLVYVDRPLYFYLQRQGSIMHTISYKHLDALDAYLERLAFLEVHFPNLFTREKFSFCTACAAFYRETLQQKSAETAQMQKRIKNHRKQVCFSLPEIMRAPIRQCLYIVGTGCCIHLFCCLLNGRHKENDHE